MVDHRGSTPAVLALAARVIRMAGGLVPVAQRSDWEREWHAELWHLYRSLEADGRVTAGERAAFVLRSVGAVFDALQFRLGDAQLWDESVSSVAARWGQHPWSVTMALLFLSLATAFDALLIAFGHIMVEAPRSVWSSLVSETRFQILAVAFLCGVSLIVASAAAAAQLLGSSATSREGHGRAWVVETVLVAAVTGWAGRSFAAFLVHTAILPHSGDWLASVDLGRAVTNGWVVSWICGLVVLTVLRVRRGGRLSGYGRRGCGDNVLRGSRRS